MPLPDAPPAIALPHLVEDFAIAAGDAERARSFTLIRPACAAGKPGEIVVCATDPKRNRLSALPDTLPEALPKAEARLSDDATLDLHVEQAQISGAPSNRAMVGLKIGF